MVVSICNEFFPRLSNSEANLEASSKLTDSYFAIFLVNQDLPDIYLDFQLLAIFKRQFTS